MQEDATADKMYFISRGTVSLTSAKHRLEDTISDGGYFGERALLQVFDIFFVWL